RSVSEGSSLCLHTAPPRTKAGAFAYSGSALPATAMTEDEYDKNALLPHNPSLTRFDKTNQLTHFNDAREIVFQFFYCLLRVQIGPVHHPVRFLENPDYFCGNPPSFESNNVYSTNHRRISICDHERRHILNDLRASAGDGMFTN